VVSVRRVTLLEAVDDRRLLGMDFAPWPRQRELLASVDHGPRLHVWALGRRSGKTTLAAVVALHNALLRPDLDALVRPGERRYAVGVATNLAQARLLVNAARSLVERSPLLAPLIESAAEDELTFALPSGARTGIRAFPCSSRGGRGWPISALVMDEAAHFITETEGHQTAERVWQALVPSTAQFGDGGRVLVCSTPYGTSGLFFDLYKRASAGELRDAAARHARTIDVNPHVDEAFLERERQRDPDSFRAEYGAEFLASGAAFLDPERIAAAIDHDRAELPPDEIVHPIAALDPAFARDPFALAIVGRETGHLRARAVGHAEDRRQRLRLALARAWQPGGRELDLDATLDAVAELCGMYGVGRVLTDQFASAPVRQGLQKRGLTATEVTMSVPVKSTIFGALKSKINLGELELYNHPALIAELHRIEAHYTAGSASVRIPRVGGSHGDLAQALALATWYASKRAPGQTDRSWVEWAKSGAGTNPRPRVDGDGLPLEEDADDGTTWRPGVSPLLMDM
jgi:hypothetical protein